MDSINRRRRVLLTGATGGIGREVAIQLAGRGCVVCLHSGHHESAAAALRSTLEGEGHAIAIGDLRQAIDRASIVRTANATLGGIDILILNAGVYVPHSIINSSIDAWNYAWDQSIAVNLTAPAELAKFVVDDWQSRVHAGARAGIRIVAVGSRGSYKGEPNAPAYGASKAGLVALVQSLAQALGPSGGFAAAVAPGIVETDMTRAALAGPAGDALRNQSPLGRVATAREIGAVITWLSLDAPLVVSGAVVDANGASHLR